MAASSASLSSSRARAATALTSAALRDMGLHRGHGERFPLDRTLHQAAADGADADAHRLDLAIHDDLDALQIRFESADGFARDLATDAAQVLGFTTAGVFVALGGLFA